MRALPILALVVAALLPLPGASACSWALSAPLERLAYLEDGTLVGATGGFFTTGPIDLEKGTARAIWPDGAVLSPDARHVVFPRQGPDVQTGPTRIGDSCDSYLSRHLVAYDRDRDTFALGERGPVWAMAAS
jgi:hypothetical protein